MSTAEDADGGRNTNVEQAVAAALERIDEFVAGDELSPLPAPLREACDRLLDKQRASARTAGLFFSFYWLLEPTWDGDSVPVGIRGKYGDKFLSEQLTQRSMHPGVMRGDAGAHSDVTGAPGGSPRCAGGGGTGGGGRRILARVSGGTGYVTAGPKGTGGVGVPRCDGLGACEIKSRHPEASAATVV